MRDVERIPRMLAVLGSLWMKHPDWRLTQLVYNVAQSLAPDNGDTYFVEDEPMLNTMAYLADGRHDVLVRVPELKKSNQSGWYTSHDRVIEGGLGELRDEQLETKTVDRCTDACNEAHSYGAGCQLGNDHADDPVNHPAHYGGDTTYETIKVLEAWDLGFHLGNAVKYISRAGKKSANREIEDLEKAVWYVNRRIAQLRGQTHG